MIGGAGFTVVCDETVIGVDKSDGWSVESKGINKHGTKQTRKTPRTKTFNNKVVRRLPARTLHRHQKIQANSFTLKGKGVMKKIVKKDAGQCQGLIANVISV